MNPEQALAIVDWIVARGLSGAPATELLDGFCKRLVAHGLPLRRAIVGLDTLHPTLEGRIWLWVPGESAREEEYTRFDATEEAWERSPFYRLVTTDATALRRRLDRDYRPGEFPVLDELRAAGATDYVALLARLGDGATLGGADCVYSSWATDRPGGFADGDVAVLERLLPHLALALLAASTNRIAYALMETYLGRDAGRRVLRGGIERGATETIRAVLWFSDLHGFTRIADTAARDQIVALLNDYADCIATAVHDHGGEVLKFIGDGILGIFRLDDDSGDACRRALDATDAALASVAELNRRRSQAGLPVTQFYLALHVGELLYGNIGSVDRLDFTVVGPAVNEASRIGAMCRSLEQDVVVSSPFAAAAGESRARLVSLGRYALRGVGRPQELFTLDPEAQPAA